MDSVPGQTFLNYAYSWGASVVILGALFKLTHLPGGNLMLFIGMGTEVVVFFLSAFDRPFDKSEVGKELPPDYETDEQIATRLGLTDDEEDTASETDEDESSAASVAPAARATANGPQGPVAGTGGFAWRTETAAPHTGDFTPDTAAPAHATAPATPQADGLPATAQAQDTEAEKLAAIIRLANDELLHRAQAVLSPEMEEATQTYIEKLRTLTETLAKVDEQSGKLTRDSEEMENLNRTLTGINKVYELHLKGISSQVGTIDQINEQTRRLAAQIEELNGVYGRMIKALTVNMKNAAASAAK